MQSNLRGRVAPTPPPQFNTADKAPSVGAYPAQRTVIVTTKERPLTRDEYRQGQDALRKIDALPNFLGGIFSGRHAYLLKTSGLLTAHRFLLNVFIPRIWPRITLVNAKFTLKLSNKSRALFTYETDCYNGLAGMNDKELKQLAMRISARLFAEYESRSDDCLTAHDGDQKALFKDRAQSEIYGHVAGAARAFNITPMHWKKYCKRKLDMRSAFSSIARLV